jgi:hypothetical protein
MYEVKISKERAKEVLAAWNKANETLKREGVSAFEYYDVCNDGDTFVDNYFTYPLSDGWELDLCITEEPKSNIEPVYLSQDFYINDNSEYTFGGTFYTLEEVEKIIAE